MDAFFPDEDSSDDENITYLIATGILPGTGESTVLFQTYGFSHGETSQPPARFAALVC